VEDLAENRRLLVELLTNVGFAVQEARNGAEAVALWESWLPHLILMDLRMPVMDGYEATRRIQTDVKNQGTVIIALTASVLRERQDAILEAGCQDFIGKPFQETIIFDKIAQHLGVEFIYEETIPIEPFIGRKLTVEDLKVMPVEWLEKVYRAAYGLDAEVLNQLIQEIPESQTSLAHSLSALVDNFDFDRIIELTHTDEV
jgi:CheY-like chemotaxis protein